MRVPVLLLILATGSFGAELHLDSAAVAYNKPTTLSLHLQSGDSELTGIQFDVEYDASRFDVKLEIGPAAQTAVKVLESSTLLPGKQRVLIFGFNRNKMGDGVVALAHVAARNVESKSTVDANQDYTIRISEPVGTSGEGQAVRVTATGGGVTTGRGIQSATRSEAR